MKIHPIIKGCGPRKNTSFTLIEVLIVIAIISVLAAMLMPTLRNARLSALDIKCASNQRQIHMAIMLYLNDHDNVYPSPLAWNEQYRQIYLFSNIITPLTFFRCPLSNNDVSDPAWSNIWYTPIPVNGAIQWTEYKLNDDGGLVDDDLGGLLRPQKVVLVIDAIDWAPRHRGKENLCFFDGHVEMMTPSQYNGLEPGNPSSVSPGWWNWGIRD
jgi:prepilin-type N-terminal cleavage/methylation domain-containing protein/prepilin-type processing-associated H-X9-DG protein